MKENPQRTGSFGEDLPSKLEIVDLINQGRKPMLDEFHIPSINLDSYHLVVPHPGQVVRASSQLAGGDVHRFFAGDGKDLGTESDNIGLTLNQANKISKFLNQPDVAELIKLNAFKEVLELEIKEGINNIKSIRKTENYKSKRKVANSKIFSLQMKRNGITMHTQILNLLKIEVKQRIEKANKKVFINL